MTHYSAYKGADDLHKMQAALANWIHDAGDCGYCHIGDLPHRIYNGLRGQFPVDEMVHLWWHGDELVGFTLAYPRHEAFDAFISPEHRGGDLERTMLEWSYATTRDWMNRADKADKPIIGDADECDHTRAEVLLSLGFKPQDKPWMYINERTLTDDLPIAALPEGFSIRGVHGEEDAEQLSAVHSGAFNSNWTPERYRDQVMRKPGYTPELERIVVAPDGRFAAFCIIWLDDKNKVGIFEPVGTHADFQRQGLGRALLAHGLRLMHERGMTTAQVGSGTKNPAANGLYRAMGFAPRHTITGYYRL